MAPTDLVAVPSIVLVLGGFLFGAAVFMACVYGASAKDTEKYRAAYRQALDDLKVMAPAIDDALHFVSWGHSPSALVGLDLKRLRAAAKARQERQEIREDIAAADELFANLNPGKDPE